jgi:ubiquinone/menaquinone biosynthesis C-methylase UbiE
VARDVLIRPAMDLTKTIQDLPGSAAGYFGSMSESYDSLIHRAVPRYDEMIARLLDYLPREPQRVLELGCGTGNLSLQLAQSFPLAELTLVDASAEMIALVRSRMDASAPASNAQVSYVEARFEELDLPTNSFDLVVSSISLHHVEDKAALYARIRALMNNGGRFCFADQIRGEPESNHALNWERWLDFCRERGHCTREEIDSLLQHAAAHDHYTTLTEHSTLLDNAGFSEIDCVWRNWMWGIVTATAT